MIDLKKSKAICEKASAWPWVRWDSFEDAVTDTGLQLISGDKVIASVEPASDYEQCVADADFIAHARTALPELVEWVERATVALTVAAEIFSVDGMPTVAARLELLLEEVEPKKVPPADEPDTVPREWWDRLKRHLATTRKLWVTPSSLLTEMHALENGR